MLKLFQGAGVLACAAILAASPAQAGCWNASEAAAAKVRDLDTMLMVSALRCRFSDVSVMERYNAFVVQDRAALVQVNDTLRAHFAPGLSAKEALNAYDNYVTAVANAYGAGAEGMSCADLGSIVDAAMADGASYDALVAVAERAGVQPRMDGGACETPASAAAPVTVAALQP